MENKNRNYTRYVNSKLLEIYYLSNCFSILYHFLPNLLTVLFLGRQSHNLKTGKQIKNNLDSDASKQAETIHSVTIHCLWITHLYLTINESSWEPYEELWRSRRCYTASTDNTLGDLHNSSYDTKAEFNNCLNIHSK